MSPAVFEPTTPATERPQNARPPRSVLYSVSVIIYCQCVTPVSQIRNSYRIEKYSQFLCQFFNYPSLNTSNIIKMTILVVNRATCFGYFLAIFRPNKEPEFRYIKCAPNGISLRLQNNETCRPVNNEYCHFLGYLLCLVTDN